MVAVFGQARFRTMGGLLPPPDPKAHRMTTAHTTPMTPTAPTNPHNPPTAALAPPAPTGLMPRPPRLRSLARCLMCQCRTPPTAQRRDLPCLPLSTGSTLTDPSAAFSFLCRLRAKVRRPPLLYQRQTSDEYVYGMIRSCSVCSARLLCGGMCAFGFDWGGSHVHQRGLGSSFWHQGPPCAV